MDLAKYTAIFQQSTSFCLSASSPDLLGSLMFKCKSSQRRLDYSKVSITSLHADLGSPFSMVHLHYELPHPRLREHCRRVGGKEGKSQRIGEFAVE